MDVKFSKHKHIGRWFDRRTSSMLDEMESKTGRKDKVGDR